VNRPHPRRSTELEEEYFQERIAAISSIIVMEMFMVFFKKNMSLWKFNIGARLGGNSGVD